MAIVRFSADLKRIILQNAQRAFNNNVDHLRSVIDKQDIALGYGKEYKTEILSLKALPEKYIVNAVNSATLRIVDVVLDSDFNTEEVAVVVKNFQLMGSTLIPHINDEPVIQIDLYNKESPLTKFALKTVKPFYDESISIEKKMSTIRVLMENYGSLNKALEHWGLLEQFVPAGYMNRTREQSAPRKERTSKPKIDKSVLDDMTVSIMTSKMMDD